MRQHFPGFAAWTVNKLKVLIEGVARCCCPRHSRNISYDNLPLRDSQFTGVLEVLKCPPAKKISSALFQSWTGLALELHATSMNSLRNPPCERPV